MTIKLAALALALLFAWFILFRPRRRTPTAKKKPPLPKELQACPECGVYRLPGGKCDCDQSSRQDD